jgi:hypothetical protein
MMLNGCNLFVEKHIFNNGTLIRHSPVGIDEISVSADVTNKIEYSKVQSTTKNSSVTYPEI